VFFCLTSARLPFNRVAYVFDRLADFAARFAERFLYFSRRFIGHALVAKTLVAGRASHSVFDFALQLIGLTLNLIVIPHPSTSKLGHRTGRDYGCRTRTLVTEELVAESCDWPCSEIDGSHLINTGVEFEALSDDKETR
jgi:hypothetical protein